jgi:YD repeat-containing protein
MTLTRQTNPALIALALMLTSCGARDATVEGGGSAVPAPCVELTKRRLKEIELRSSSSAAVTRTVKHYDGLGRIVRVEMDFDGDGMFEQVEHFTYDELGRLVELENADSVERYQLDSEGRVAVQEVQRKGSKLIARTVITYDKQGRTLRVVSDVDDVRYEYDAAGRETREQRFRPDEEVPYVDYVSSYDAAGRRVRLEGFDPTGRIRKTWRYDERGREKGESWYRDDVLLLTTRMDYDAAGRRIREEYVDAQDRVTGSKTWTYDAEGRELAQRTERHESKEWSEERYGYIELKRCR